LLSRQAARGRETITATSNQIALGTSPCLYQLSKGHAAILDQRCLMQFRSVFFAAEQANTKEWAVIDVESEQSLYEIRMHYH
jgi:hypothetical protein